MHFSDTDWCTALIPAVMSACGREVKAPHWTDYPAVWAIEQGYEWHSRRPATGTRGADRLTPGLRV